MSFTPSIYSSYFNFLNFHTFTAGVNEYISLSILSKLILRAPLSFRALFSRALAELKYLGMIKSSRKKADHVAKLLWKGL